MGRGRTGLTRFSLATALVAVAAGVVVATAAALAFDDAEPCGVQGQVYVCPSGTVQAPYSIQLIGRGGCGPALPYQYGLLNGTLPNGLSLTKSGVISGTPTNAGTWNFWVELSDEDPPSQSWCLVKKAEREFSITIVPRVLVTTESAVPGTIGTPYSLALVAVMKVSPDGTVPPSSPLTWSVVSGQLPPGVTLDTSTGLLSGTPTTEGAFSFIVKAALVDGRSDTKGLTIVVRQPLAIQAPKPFATVGAPTRWEVGVRFAGKLTATGGSGTYVWSLAEGSLLPAGLALATDGTIAGRPTTAGTFRSTIHLADNEGRAADYQALFNIAPKLAIKTLRLRPAKVGRLYRQGMQTLGGVLPKKTKVKGRLPRGIRFDAALSVFTGTPQKAGTYRVTVEVTDGLDVKAKRTFTIVVLP